MTTLRKSGHAPVNGIEMYYEVHGEGGTPLVLIHGGGSTFDSTFEAILPFLAADFLHLLAIILFPAMVLALPTWLGQ